jgi:predicted ArsR family transcriptional regulator
MSKAGFNRRAIKILRYLDGNGGVEASDVADHNGITHQSAGTKMKTLKNRGMVEVTGYRATGGRPAKVYEITDKGEEKLDWMEKIIDIVKRQNVDWDEAVSIWKKNRP